MNESIKTNQTLSYIDFLRTFFYELPKMKIAIRIFIIVTVVGILNFLLDFTSPIKHQATWYILILKLVMAPLFLIVFGLIAGSVIAFMLMLLRPNHFKNVSFEFNHWGMIKKGKGFEFSRPWSGFTQYRETKRFIFLYIKENDAHIIKKSSFQSNNQLVQFKSLILGKLI